MLSVSLSPTDCFIIYCAKEEDWLKNPSLLSKIFLTTFELIEISASDGNKIKDIVEIQFDYNCSVMLQFESLTKKQQWCDEIDKIRCMC